MKILTIIFFIILGFFTHPRAAEAACNFHQLMTSASKDVTNFTSTCTITAVEGIDNPQNTETSTTTNASLTLGTNSAITINNGGTLAVNSLTINAGTIAIQTGGQILLNIPLYVADGDADGYAVDFTLYTASASGRRRLGLMRDFTTVDCGDSTYSTANSCYISATGGTITTSGNYKIHTFTGSGTFTVTGTGSVEYLVVAGGGGGGGGTGGTAAAGGGGGGGQAVYSASYSVNNNAISVTVGAGGISGRCGGPGDGCSYSNPPLSGGNGENSVFGTITASGGGGGGISGGSGLNGGTGGGGGTYYGGGGTGTSGYGGGQGSDCNTPCRGGGGGGAGAAGVAGVTSGNGGIGYYSTISGSGAYYGGGGGGSAYSNTGHGAGGSGGGASGFQCSVNGSTGCTNGNNGTANTGGGGSSGGGSERGWGGAGGSGIVIVKYQFQ